VNKSHVGVVKELFRYPVKSMLGESLAELEVCEKGVVGDRAWALRERNGRIVSAKKWANLLDFRASYDASPKPEMLAPITIAVPDGRRIHADDTGTSVVLSKALGREVTLDRAQADEHARAEIDPKTVFSDVGVEHVKPEFTEATLPDSYGLLRGGFFDDSAIHFLTTGSLSQMYSLIGADAQLDPRRFRPNIFIETDPRESGFIEDQWLAGTLEVGDSVKIVKLKPALRCVMTTHRQEELVRDQRILRAAAQHHAAQLGVFASIGASGRVRIGDPVWFVT
jgi:uncharacterized protein YcbX